MVLPECLRMAAYSRLIVHSIRYDSWLSRCRSAGFAAREYIASPSTSRRCAAFVEARICSRKQSASCFAMLL